MRLFSEALLGSGAGGLLPGCGNAVGAQVQHVCRQPSWAGERGEGGASSAFQPEVNFDEVLDGPFWEARRLCEITSR